MLTECSASTGRGLKCLFFRQLGGPCSAAPEIRAKQKLDKKSTQHRIRKVKNMFHARTQSMHNTLMMLFCPAAKTMRTALHELMKNKGRTGQVFIRCTWRGKENHCCRQKNMQYG